MREIRGVIAATFWTWVAVFAVGTGHAGATNVLAGFLVLSFVIRFLANTKAAVAAAAEEKPWVNIAVKYCRLCAIIRTVAVVYAGWWGLAIFAVLGNFFALAAQGQVKIAREARAA